MGGKDCQKGREEGGRERDRDKKTEKGKTDRPTKREKCQIPVHAEKGGNKFFIIDLLLHMKLNSKEMERKRSLISYRRIESLSLLEAKALVSTYLSFRAIK